MSHISYTDYVAIGPRFSNLVLQAMLVLLRKIPPVVVSFRMCLDKIKYLLSVTKEGPCTNVCPYPILQQFPLEIFKECLPSVNIVDRVFPTFGDYPNKPMPTHTMSYTHYNVQILAIY